MLARCHSRTHKSHTTQKSSLFVALTRCTCMPPLGQVVHIRVSKCSARSSTQNPPENPRGARPRALCVCGARCVCVSVWVSLATLTRYADGSMQIQKRGTVYSVCMQTRNGASNGSGSGLTGCLSRAHRACAPKPTRMAVGLTRDCRETLRRDVQGSSESSTRRSANSKRHAVVRGH